MEFITFLFSTPLWLTVPVALVFMAVCGEPNHVNGDWADIWQYE